MNKVHVADIADVANADGWDHITMVLKTDERMEQILWTWKSNIRYSFFQARTRI